MTSVKPNQPSYEQTFPRGTPVRIQMKSTQEIKQGQMVWEYLGFYKTNKIFLHTKCAPVQFVAVNLVPLGLETSTVPSVVLMSTNIKCIFVFSKRTEI